MTESRMLEDKVALVTGSGRGVGRDIAILMAQHGAKVIVNDLGATEQGDGADQVPALEVVKTIRDAGGEAEANGDSVADFAAAKLGIVGLSKSVALDMARYNVTSNAIGPFAWSRLIGTIPITDEAQRERVERMKTMTTAKIAPLIVALCSDAGQEVTGQIFCVRSNEIFLMGQSRPIRGMQRGEGWTPETVAEHCFPAMRSQFYPLERSADIFCWDPV